MPHALRDIRPLHSLSQTTVPSQAFEMASTPQPVMPLDSLFHIKAATYAPVAATSLLVYDFLLTFPDEVRLIWPEPWRLGKILFFLTRYPVIINSCITLFRNVALIVPNCWGLDTQVAYVSLAWITVAEIIMGIRVWALWERSWKIAVFVAFLILSNLIITAYCEEQHFTITEIYVAPPDLIKFIPGCHDFVGAGAHFDPRLSQVPYYLLMSVETAMLILMLAKSFGHYELIPHSRFLLVFYQDGLMYFTFLAVLSVVNIVVLKKAATEYGNLLLSLQRSLHAMLSARFLLHLREESNRNRSINGDGEASLGPIAFHHSVPGDQEENTNSMGRWVDDGTWFTTNRGGQRTHVSSDVESRFNDSSSVRSY